MSHSVTTKRLNDEASAGWTTYGTSRAALSLFQGIVKDDMNAPRGIKEWFHMTIPIPVPRPARNDALTTLHLADHRPATPRINCSVLGFYFSDPGNPATSRALFAPNRDHRIYFCCPSRRNDRGQQRHRQQQQRDQRVGRRVGGLHA